MANLQELKEAKILLDRKYDLLVNKQYEISEKTFFVGIADYVGASAAIPAIYQIVMDYIVAQQQKERAKVDTAEEVAVKELDQTAKKLLNYIKKNKITNPAIEQAIKEYTQYINGDLKTSQTPAVARFHYNREIAEGIEALGGKYKKYCNSFLIPAGDGLNTKYNFGKSYYDYEDTNEQFNNEQEVAVWGSWNEMAVAFNAFFRSQEIKEEYSGDRDKFLEFWNWAGIIKERDEIMKENKEGQRSQFKRDKYLYYLWQVHNYLLDQIYLKMLVRKDESKSNEPTGEEVTTVKGLFEIADNPPRIKYIGSKAKDTEESAEWIKPKGRTQAFAVLSFAAEKYKRNSSVEPVKFIKLSFEDIKTRLANKEYCNKVLNWESAPTPARFISTIKRNIKSIIPLTDNQLTTETKKTSYLVFNIQ